MDRVALGRTGLMVSPAGLGCGGYSRLGMQEGDASIAEGVVNHALDLGVNFFDTARAYGTEEVVGRCVAGRRDDVVISTKAMYVDRDLNYLPPEKLIESLEKSLRRMNTDYVDVFSLHGVVPEYLDHCIDVLVPALQREVEKGKIRFIGVTESFMHDPAHEMLKRAIPSDLFDVVMVGFNFLNPGARDTVFPLCQKQGVATQVMHAVRRALANQDLLVATVADLIDSGEIEASLVNSKDPAGFLAQHPEVGSVVEAAYRFCRHEPGISVVLTGTGSKAHLEANVNAIGAPPLPDELLASLDTIFGRVRSVSGD